MQFSTKYKQLPKMKKIMLFSKKNSCPFQAENKNYGSLNVHHNQHKSPKLYFDKKTYEDGLDVNDPSSSLSLTVDEKDELCTEEGERGFTDKTNSDERSKLVS